jgi:hypothetical protein
VILADRQGRTKFLLASQYRLRRQDEAAKGYHPLAAFNVPLRRLRPRDGCWRYVRYFQSHHSAPRKETAMNLMQTAVLDILRRHGLDKAFNTATEFHLKVENPPFTPLVIERQGNIISVAHYGELNGDAIRDPELEFLFPTWEPLSITQDPVGRYEEVSPVVNGQAMNNPRLLRELRLFANLWARNLMAQGFGNPGVTVSSLTHPLQPAGQK